MKQELVDKLAAVEAEIKATNEALASLAKQRNEVIQRADIDTPTPGYMPAPGSTATEQLAAIGEDSQELRQKAENLTELKSALEKKLSVFKDNQPKTEAIRKQITGELWPKTVKAYRKLRAALADAEKILAEVDELNNRMGQAAMECERLAGEQLTQQPHVYVEHAVGFGLQGNPAPVMLKDWIRQLADVSETLELKFRSELTKPTPKKLVAAKPSRKTRTKRSSTGLVDTTVYVDPREALHKADVGSFEDLARQPGVNVGSTAVIDPTDPRIKSAGGAK